MRVFLMTLALLVPVPALALSCMAPTIERSYAHYEASEDVYIVVHGRLKLDTSLLPEGMTSNPPPPDLTRVPAKIDGKSLAKSGFNAPFEQPLTLEVACIGPWCGGVQDGAEVLAFLRKDAKGYALAISPCGGAFFGDPKPEMLKQVRQCFVKKNCSAN